MSKGPHDVLFCGIMDPGELWVQILFSMGPTFGVWRRGFPTADLGEMKSFSYWSVLSYSRFKVIVTPADMQSSIYLLIYSFQRAQTD